MKKIFLGLCLALVVASCGQRNTSAPRNLDNACSILEQRRGFKPAFVKAQRKYGIPVHVQMAIIHQESRFISNARTPRKYILGVIPNGRVSSAYGYGQALDGTWAEYKRKTGRRFASRTDIRDVADFIGYYATESRRRNGVSMYDARGQYLNYHEGHGGYSRGSYRSKSWLINVANKVQTRADMYQRQLARCL